MVSLEPANSVCTIARVKALKSNPDQPAAFPGYFQQRRRRSSSSASTSAGSPTRDFASTDVDDAPVRLRPGGHHDRAGANVIKKILPAF
jgi:hypothetical protein